MDVTRRIISERANGRTFRTIADGSMADGISTARGKTQWFPATIRAGESVPLVLRNRVFVPCTDAGRHRHPGVKKFLPQRC